MKIAEAFLKSVGESGLPKGVPDSLNDTWLAYIAERPEDDRLMSVLGFLHLLKQAGATKGVTITGSAQALYTDFRLEEFDALSSALLKQLQKLHVFDTLRIFKSKFVLDRPIRGEVETFRFDLCLVPRKSESLDSALARLRGFLYVDEVPRQLQETYKKISVNSKSNAKSSRLPYTRIVANSSTVGFLPVAIDTKAGYSIYATRAKDDMLIVRITVNVATRRPLWHTSMRMHEDFLKGLLQKALSKLKR